MKLLRIIIGLMYSEPTSVTEQVNIAGINVLLLIMSIEVQAKNIIRCKNLLMIQKAIINIKFSIHTKLTVL